MADKTKVRNENPVFWSNIATHSSDEDCDAYVPGLSAPGNKRPGRMKCRKTKEIKAKIPIKQPLSLLETVTDSFEKYDDPGTKSMKSRTKGDNSGQMLTKGRSKKPTSGRNEGTFNKDESSLSTTAFESFAERSIQRLKKASLKDLRPEDKQRVANLIKELARVSEEKETVVKELHGERDHYEKQLVTMVDQQEKILKEREDIQEKLFQCQRLLTEYQSQLLNKQEKLNTSINDIREEMMEEQYTKQKLAKHDFSPIQSQNGVVEICPPCFDTDEERSLTPVCLNPPHRYIPTNIAPDYVAQKSAPNHAVQSTAPNSVMQKPVPNSASGKMVYKVAPNKVPHESQHASERKSRSRDPASHPRLTSQNQYCDNWTNQNQDQDESVSDLLLNSKDPKDNIRRPFTSLIDKEIARERSQSRDRSLSAGSRSSSVRSRSRSPSEGRPKFAYPDKLINLGPLHDPIASSTHKSMEIKAQMSNNGDLDSPRSSIQGHFRDDLRVKGQTGANKQNSKVVFSEKDEYNEDSEKHSPNTKSSGQLFNDPDYAQYYKKLSPGGRKRELLKQRQALLDEQERLRLVLEKQERQLKERQHEYNKRQELQKERMEFYKQGGKFPALKLDFDGDDGKLLEEAQEREMENGIETKMRDKGGNVYERAPRQGVEGRHEGMSGYEEYSPRNVEIDDEIQIRSRVSMGTSPMATPPHGNKVTMARSPIASHGLANDQDEPRHVDVATSISYRTPLKDASNRQDRQGNLPLAVNRQRSSPSYKSSPRSPRADSMPTARTPGEKTLNVIELVNSMEEEPRSVKHQFEALARFEDLENRPTEYSPSKYRAAKGNQSEAYRQYTSPGHGRKGQGKLLDDEQESAEESQILEDIFFL